MTPFNQIEKIEQALNRHFERRRIVFWYDGGELMREQFDLLDIDEVTKLVISNNEFSLKYRILVQEPNQKFLIYAPFARPEDRDNWLIDVLLSGEQFYADISSLYIQEVGLPLEYKWVVEKHKTIFDSTERRAKLAKLVIPTDTPAAVQLKAMSVAISTEPDYDKIWYALFEEELRGQKAKYNMLTKSNLIQILWDKAEVWGYKQDSPTIKDLLVTLFRGAFYNSIGEGTKNFTAEAKLFMNRWKENVKGRTIYIAWSTRLEEELGAKALISDIDIHTLLDSDLFTVIDRKIISEILKHIISQTEPNHILQEWIDIRKMKMFYGDYQRIYKALSSAATIQNEIQNTSFNLVSEDDMFLAYSGDSGWHIIDRLYRHYIYNAQNSEHKDLLKPLTKYIDKIYSNGYLLKLSESWQEKVDKMSKWDRSPWVLMQRNFYKHWVKPYAQKDKRIFVIISDALRYETASELKELLIAEDRYSVKITPTMGMIPSYTQLAMAAMLPHTKLSYDRENDTVFVDGVSSSGTSNRSKILKKEYAESIAITAKDFLGMNAKTQGREFCKEHKVIYIYSNIIDNIGDDKITENRVFDATEDEFSNLIVIVKQIANMNGSNIIITSDHGYLYQNSQLDPTDYTEFSPLGDIYKTARRFVIGKNLSSSDAVNKWSADMLLLDGDVEVLTAKSINRIRVHGAGAQFVHGGSSLQEIVIPVLEISRTRKDILEQVSVDVIGLPNSITSNLVPISLYQQSAVSEKVVPMTVKAAFYSKDGEQISDSTTFVFDSRDNDSRKREKKYTFTFTPEVAKYNSQDVILRLETPIASSSQYIEYKTYNIRMMISIYSEFDF